MSKHVGLEIYIFFKEKKEEEKSTFSVQIFAKKFLQLWEFNPSQANHSTGCNRLLFTLNEYELVMIPRPVVTCIYCCIYPSSCGSKYKYAAVAAAFFNYEKNPMNFRNSVQAPFTLVAVRTEKSHFYLISFQMEAVSLIILIVFHFCHLFENSVLLHLICPLVSLIFSNTPFAFLPAFVLWADICNDSKMSLLRGKS